MENTTYAGIDYGLGKTNCSNGIRYGCISQNSVNPDALDDIYSQGEDLSYGAMVDEVKAGLRSALSDYFSDYSHKADEPSDLDSAVQEAFNAIQDGLNDNYQPDNARYRYEKDGYVIETSELGLMILKSPWVTNAQFCSPCVPGAGNLNSPCSDGPLTFALGSEWFDDETAPYPVSPVSPA